MEKDKLIKIALALFAGCFVYATPLLFDNKTVVEISPPQEEKVVVALPNLEELPPEEEEIQEDLVYIDYLAEQSIFELPLQGATAYASVELNFRDAPTGNSLGNIPQGSGFTILQDYDDYWQVDYEGREGFVYANYCLLNLPDVLPSAIYDNANGYASAFRSSFTDIPNVTGVQFYDSLEYNERLGYEEYTMAILYQTAKKVAQVQRSAMENGETLIINETYRPFFIQEVVVENLTALMNQNPTVREGVNTYPWSIDWFIAVGVSTHQRGCAIDTSLGKIVSTEERYAGDYVYTAVVDYVELDMPTPIHELSLHSASETRDITYVEVEVTSQVEPDWNPEAGEIDPEGEESTPETSEIPAQQDETEENPPQTEEVSPPVETAPEPAPDLTLPDPTPAPESFVPAVDEVDSDTLGAIIETESIDFFNPLGNQVVLVQTLGEFIDPVYTTQTVYGPWRSNDTMTADARKLENYFKTTGMVSIYSEWWHFEDNNNQSNNESRGGYVLTGNVSRIPTAPYQLASES